MGKEKKIITIYKYIDWWLVEVFCLLWIVSGTYRVLHTLIEKEIDLYITGNSIYGNILSAGGIIGMIAFLFRVNEENEKRAFLLCLIALILYHIDGFVQIYGVNALLNSCGFIFVISAYYYFRKAGQYRRLNCIKTPFGKKGKKSLILNVIFLESIAITLGMDAYLFIRKATQTTIYIMAFLISTLLGGFIIYCLFKLPDQKTNSMKIVLSLLAWTIFTTFIWFIVFR